MPKTRAELTAYSRGYYAGSRKAWPDYHPPEPPDELSAEIMRAAINLAYKAAEWCGAFGEDDEFSKEMRPLIEAVDHANAKVTKWLQAPTNETENHHD